MRTFPHLLPLLALLAPYSPAAGSALPREGGSSQGDSLFAFVDVHVVPMDSERVLERQTVVVRGDRIAAVGPAGRTAVPAGATRIDGRGKYLTPGLIDMHGHLSPGAGSIDDAAGQQLALLIANGITTARMLIGPPNRGAIAIRDRIARGELLGPRIYAAGPSLNGQSVSSPAVGRLMVEETKAAGFDLLKTHGGLSREAYDTIVAAAKRADLPLVGHVSHEVGLQRSMEAGQQIEHLDGWIAALIPPDAGVEIPASQIVMGPALRAADEGRIPELARRNRELGVWNSPTLALFELIVSDDTPETLLARPEMRYASAQARENWANQKRNINSQHPPREERQRFVELRRQMVRALGDAGAKLLVGSDSPQLFLPAGFTMHREMATLEEAGLTPYQVLEAATRNAAEWLGAADEFGTVTAGRAADLLLLDASPLEAVGNAQRIQGVMLRGRWLPRTELDTLLRQVERAVDPS